MRLNRTRQRLLASATGSSLSYVLEMFVFPDVRSMDYSQTLPRVQAAKGSLYGVYIKYIVSI